MLVSPDPIGPVDERLDAWSDAMELADANGWYICVLGASAPWLPIYRAAGLTEVYMGDEAIVDCQTFSLKGKSMKSLRGAYNRVSKAGYHVDVMPSLDASPELRRQLEELATETRQGEVERGFSMTLSRMFDERDTGLLLAVCLDPDGKPVAFNQYVPASHVNGYSLDVMRRTSDPDAPNGLTDFVIIETHQLDGRAGPGRPRPQLRHHARGGRRGDRLRAVAFGGEVRAPSLQRQHADRVAVELQQEVRPRVASPLLGR